MSEDHLSKSSRAARPGRLMSWNRRGAGHLFVCATLFAALAFTAPADVLVMQDGSRVETKGAWEVKGRQVLFTLPNGTLSAVRLSEVDLDASQAATEAANRPPESEADADGGAEAEPREPVLVLTNEDIGAGPSQLDADETPADEDEAASSGGLVVAEWSYEPAGVDPVYQLTGRLENRTGLVVENIQLYVDFIAVDGGTPRPDVHFLREARVMQSRLEPNDSADFRYGISVRDLEYSGAAEQFESPRVTFDVQYRSISDTRGDDDEEFDEQPDADAEVAAEDDDSRP